MCVCVSSVSDVVVSVLMAYLMEYNGYIQKHCTHDSETIEISFVVDVINSGKSVDHLFHCLAAAVRTLAKE